MGGAGGGGHGHGGHHGGGFHHLMWYVAFGVIPGGRLLLAILIFIILSGHK